MKPYKTLVFHEALALAASAAARTRATRLKNWVTAEPVLDHVTIGTYNCEPFHYRGRFRGWTGFYYRPCYTSSLEIQNRFHAVYSWGFSPEIKSRNLRTPAGTEWDYDGSIVVSNDYEVEYHPSGEDLQARDFCQRVKQGLKRSRLRREKLRRDEHRLVRLANGNLSFTVSIADSISVGNCEAGTRAWAQQHGFGNEALARDVLDADPTNRLVQLTVLHAMRRHDASLV